jgi:hypothetical protein
MEAYNNLGALFKESNVFEEARVNFLKVLQSDNSEQDGFDGICEAFGKILYAHQVIDDMYKQAAIKAGVLNQSGLVATTFCGGRNE